MGEVYRARDSRLDRTVAIKVLPSRFSSDPRLRERFEREAKAISALSHPHICALFDVGTQDGVDYLVMEFLEGESLADRLARGPLPIEQVLRYGVQIAEALEKAHRAGIVHRDLKPGNVIVTRSGAKLLDFGLAKIAQPQQASSPDAMTAAMSHQKPLTEEGSVLGTFQYMAPEQIEGRDTDKRSDIFALGALLYEMATGKRAFEAKSRASLIASILDREPPPISTVQPLTPRHFERVVQLCLAKDPDERWQSAHDVAAELKWIAASSTEGAGPGVAKRRGRKLARALAMLAAGAVLGAAAVWVALRDRSAPVAVARFSVPALPSAPLLLQLGSLAVSPDGSVIVYRGGADRRAMLYRRSAGVMNAEPIAGTEDAHAPAFSPDGRWIAFTANNAIWKVPIEGGTRVRLASSPGGGVGLSWTEHTIVAARSFTGGLWMIPAAGGEPRQIAKTNSSTNERAITWPDVLPGGNTVLATVWNAGAWDDARIMAYSVRDGSSKLLVNGGSFARYAESGHLLFMRAGNLMAVRFDIRTLTTSGNPVAVVNGVAYGSADGEAHYAVSRAGHLVYAAGGDSLPRASLLWIDRRGQQQPIVPTLRRYGSIDVSPDERSALVTIESSTYDIWQLDFDRDSLTRVSHGGDDADAIFTPDATGAIWTSSRTGTYNLYTRRLDNTGAEERLTVSQNYQELPAVSPDGSTIVFGAQGQTGDVYAMPLSTRKPRPLIATEFHESSPAVSPDGRWLAYTSNESGRNEVYVTSFPEPAGKWQVSTNGGIAPEWMPDGREIAYLQDGNKFMVAPIELTPRLRAGRPRLLAEGNFDDEYSVARDGRLAVIRKEATKTASHFNVVLNWFDELKRRVP
jgi:Tol biopolymer transport system component